MHFGAFRASRRADPLGRYYTATPLSRFVVSRLPAQRPKLVLDLGSGDGALSLAASDRWSNAEIVAVDTDPGVIEREGTRGRRLRLVRADALGISLSTDTGIQISSVPMAVCNPPFIRPRWRRQFAEVLEDANLSGCYSAVEEAGAAVLFLAQNLRFLQHLGHLAIIVPDGILSGVKHRALRAALLARHEVVEVVELPSGTFQRTEVKTHVLVIRKGGPRPRRITIRRLLPGGNSTAVMVPAVDCELRMDFSYHGLRGRRPGGGDSTIALGDVATAIERGRAVSSERQNLCRPALHTTELTGGRVLLPPSRFQWTKKEVFSARQVFAEKGDIIVARVGRFLENQVGILGRGPVALTDCVFRLAVPEENRMKVLEFLTSERGKAELSASASGTGARHLSKAALSSLRIPGVQRAS